MGNKLMVADATDWLRRRGHPISEAGVRSAIQRGSLKTVRVWSRIYIEESELEHFERVMTERDTK